ncbi:MAG: hypothetical protein ACI9MC_000079 [Kiritimatiellia bacterium]|jgi:hypothetical protein
MSDTNWLEEPTRLSQSVLWDLQRRFYESTGKDAWAEEIVPTQVSTNAYMAEAYAAMLLEWAESLNVENQEPIYIVEIGAGSGRLGARVAGALRRRRVEGSPRLIYVLTDLAERNIEFWNEHPVMKELVADGLVDFARLDLEDDAPIVLQHSGVTLAPGSQPNPIGIVGNYIVDTVRQDLFRVRDGRIFEVLVRAKGPDSDATDVVNKVTLSFDEVPIRDDYYSEPELNDLLKTYGTTLTDSNVLVPIGLLRNLRRLCAIGGQRALFISGDKALRHLHEWQGTRRPHLATHGSISVMANFHAVGHLFDSMGGSTWHARSSTTRFTISAFLLDDDPALRSRCRRAFVDWLDDFGPSDFHRLYKLLRKIDLPDLTWLLLLVRLSSYDPRTLLRLAGQFRKILSDAPKDLKRDTGDMLEEVWLRRYRVSSNEDLSFQLARLYTRLGRYDDGLRFYRVSLGEDGPHRAVFHNMGLCLERLNRLDEAAVMLEKALEIDPDYELAKQRLARVKKKLE